jgi:glycosyltransferase involved in cell wall biosynthesis
MKIGIDCRIYSSKFTGIGRYVHELTTRLFALDKENEYVLFFNEPEYSKFTPPSERIKKVLADAPIYSLREQFHFLKVLNKENLDLMHFTHFNAPLFYKRPSIVTIHDLTLSFFPGKKKRSILHRLGYHLTLRSSVKKAKHVITISQNSREDLEELLKTPDEKIEVIYQGIGDEFKKIDDKVEIEKTLTEYHIKTPFLLYTGVWRSHKNIPNLINAFKELKDIHGGEELSLVITGKEDPYYPEVKETVKKHNLEENVIFTDLVPEKDLINLYNAAEIYVFPSFYEGFGLPPLEAMACGTPVAASDVSSIPEVCGKGNAVFFNPRDYHDIAQKVYALYTNKDMQQDLIKKGFERVKQFSWNSMVEKTFAIYNKN